MYKSFELAFLLCCVYNQRMADAHGRLVKPPGRSTMWRYGFNTPIDYNDNQLFCGGKAVQWEQNDGKCGVCGDPYNENPRSHEAGGKYAGSVLAGYYNKGSTIDVSVEITANHKGWFEFRLCKNDNFSKTFTHDCLDEHVLALAAYPRNTRHNIDDANGFKNFTLQLPLDLTCSQCVLQWKYNTGNSWGVDETGTGCLGCGEQEQFYACSDIAIFDTLATSNITSTPLSTTTAPTTTPTTTTGQSTGSQTSNTNTTSTILSTVLRSNTSISETTTAQSMTTTKLPTTTRAEETRQSTGSQTSNANTTSTILSTLLRSSTSISETTTPQPITSTPQPTTVTSQPTTNAPQPTTVSSQPTTSTRQPTTVTSQPTTNTPQPTTTTQQPTTSTTEETSTSTTTATSGGLECKGIAPYYPTDEWCDTNCNHNPPFCPSSHCSCS